MLPSEKHLLNEDLQASPKPFRCAYADRNEGNTGDKQHGGTNRQEYNEQPERNYHQECRYPRYHTIASSRDHVSVRPTTKLSDHWPTVTLGGKETVNKPECNDAAERASGSLERVVELSR